ncbi:ParA family protein [Massilia genomosp. 1]|uniref:AAA family ATPase n=1 Tax=Massilia genomosp. 1 TaxID=2609280 RepID=A0ABX0N062_9BURK|nr:AAA family ATPase [Massilia genomosp. 1]
MTRTFKAQAIATILGTTSDTIRRATEESGLDVQRQETGPRTRIYTIENVYELAQWRAQKKGDKKPKKPVVVTVYVPKGGVGKSTIAANLACIFPTMGLKTLVVDLDFQSNLTLAFGYDSELSHEEAEEDGLSHERVVDHHFGSLFPQWPQAMPLEEIIKKPFGEYGPHVIPSDVSLDNLDTIMTFEALESRNSASMFAKLISDGRTGKRPGVDLSSYDVIIFDAAPAKNRMTRSALLASDYVVAPISLEKFSTKAVSYLSRVLNEMKEEAGRCPELLIVGNFFDVTRTRVLNQTAMIRRTYNDQWMNSIIRRSEDFPKTLSSDTYELPLFLSKPNSPGAEDLRKVASDLLAKMGVL